MAVQGRRIFWIVVLSFYVVLEPWRTHSQITEGPSISSPSCNEEYLIAVENKTNGIAVNVVSKHHRGVLEYREFSHYLSSQCGEHNFRCQDLLVVSSASTAEKNKHIVFVPLLDGIFLLEVSYNGKITDHYNLRINACSPTAVFKILERIIVVCLNQATGYLTTMRINLDAASIRSSTVSAPQINHFSGLTNSPHLSDFKYINSDNSDIPNFQWILFATSNYVYSLSPLSNDFRAFSDDLGNCSIPESIVYIPDDVLLVHCRDSAVYFSLAYENVINRTHYSEHGQPFLCPNPDVRIAVFASASYIQYRVLSYNSRENFNIHDMKFDSGVCFGSKTHTLFAYNDVEGGVYVLDTATSNLAHLSSKACLNSHCEPLMVFQNRYIVIREREKYDANVIVVDLLRNYTAVITAEHVRADVQTLLVIEQDSSFCSNDSPSPSTPTLASPPSGKEIAGPVAGSIVGLVIVLVSFIIVFTVYKRRRRHKKKESSSIDVPCQETRDTESQSSGLVQQSDGESNGERQDDADRVPAEGVYHETELNKESHGDPSFVTLPNPNQVYSPSSPPQGSSDQGSSHKPNENTFPLSDSTDCGDENRWVFPPASVESKVHQYDSGDEFIPGAVPLPQTVRQKPKQKRAKGGNYEQLHV